MQQEVSVEVSWEIIRDYILRSFDILEEEMVQTTYCHDPLSDMSVVYDCIAFVAKKKMWVMFDRVIINPTFRACNKNCPWLEEKNKLYVIKEHNDRHNDYLRL